MTSLIRIAVDAMGGDFAPEEIVLGAVVGARKFGCEVFLVGDESRIRASLLKSPDWDKLPVHIVHASETIDMHDQPGAAVRRKKDASIVVATRLVKEKKCDVAIAAGHTGAAAAAALFGLGRISGIERAAIATVLPNMNGKTVMLDAGANVDSKPKHLVQAAIMGSIYSEYVLGIKNPRVGLLNIGEEPSKGNEQALATFPLLSGLKTINFIGNIEGRDITAGTVDVVVCDGFVGNVVLKTAEGLAKSLLQLVKETILQGGYMAKLGGLLIMPAMQKLKNKLDYAEYGGAPLLGVEGGFMICHGSSRARAIESAVRAAKEFSEQRVVEHIRENLIREGLTNDTSDSAK
jgi:glycerol-3-phosphate acyltransferase PlsX